MNLLGVALASLMKFPDDRKAASKALAYRRIAGSDENEAKKYFLAEIVENYLKLDEAQQKEFESMSKHEEIGMDDDLLAPWRELHQGEGRAEGQREILRMILEQRFSPLPESALARLNAMPSEELTEAAGKVLTAETLDELLPPGD